MSDSIFLLCPNSKIGTPANERFKSFESYFKQKGLTVDIIEFPNSLISQLIFLVIVLKKRPNYLFISQPPFRFWMIFFLPFLKIILDIRDGWSISIKSGYGGIVSPNIFKYRFVSLIERIMIKRSSLVVTCTFGLKNYLESKYKKELIFLPNGLSKKNYNFIRDLNVVKGENNNKLIFSCAGQFSEYGADKVKNILKVISNRYSGIQCVIQIIGADKKRNDWLNEYVNNFTNIEYIYIDRVDQQILYTILKNSDYALAIIRDPNYDYGTKIFDYIACDLKVINYFSQDNGFIDYFKGCFDTDEIEFNKSIIREDAFADFDYAFSRRKL